jgi:hypothetical protein
MLTGDVVPKLKVGGLAAPFGLEASAAVNVTLPMNPPLGVTVIVDVLPVVAPGELMAMAPPLVRANETGAAVTFAVTIVVCVIVPEVPVTVTM